MKLLKELITTTSPSGKEVNVQKIIIRELHKYDVKPKIDKMGNIYVFHKTGDVPKNSVLFTAHMDSVHNDQPVEIMKGVIIDQYGSVPPAYGWCLTPTCKQTAMGADDKVGVRMLLHLIQHGVEGVYIFTVQEECGCVGAKAAASRFKSGMIDSAICFDRKDTCSVITAMGGADCCSDEFSEAIIEQLGMGHRKDRGGSITDTKSFKDVVLNYTNISAGYYHEHTKKEWVDINYVKKLMSNILAVDWAGLPKVPYVKPKPVAALPYNRFDDDYSYPDTQHKKYTHKSLIELWKPDIDIVSSIEGMSESLKKSWNTGYSSPREIAELLDAIAKEAEDEVLDHMSNTWVLEDLLRANGIPYEHLFNAN